ncbi:MAG TPA: GNAT family N-acetyltransferase [Solirubrobacteraceae bacterium]|jgi:ribosomal protein S18 acetylase RimI-like enzyme|nr:GNAT family N-acetyltransferase [Solirubrobacteraceae bacterium]
MRRSPSVASAGSVCHASRVSRFEIVVVPVDGMEELQPVWRSLYDHHLALTPHLSDRTQPFERAWQARQRIEAEWQARGEDLFVLAAKAQDRYVGYALVRIRSGTDFAASWDASERLAELVILAVLPDWRGQGVGSALLDAVEARLRGLAVEDMVINVVTNDDAMRLYRRRGAEPFVTELIQRVSPGDVRGG